MVSVMETHLENDDTHDEEEEGEECDQPLHDSMMTRFFWIT